MKSGTGLLQVFYDGLFFSAEVRRFCLERCRSTKPNRLRKNVVDNRRQVGKRVRAAVLNSRSNCLGGAIGATLERDVQYLVRVCAVGPNEDTDVIDGLISSASSPRIDDANTDANGEPTICKTEIESMETLRTLPMSAMVAWVSPIMAVCSLRASLSSFFMLLLCVLCVTELPLFPAAA